MVFTQSPIHIDGKTYPMDMARRGTDMASSHLQNLFQEHYGADSFHMSLADFIAEWLDESEMLKVHTSGSTGKPKGLWVEKRRMVNSAQATVAFLGLQQGDTALLCMPLPYIAGKMVVVRSLIAGLNIQVVTPCGHPLAAVDQIPDFAAMTPMQIFNTLAVPEELERLKQIKHLIIGGGSINPEMALILRDFPQAVWSTYGMTETLSHIALRRLSGPTASLWYTPFEGVSVSLSEEATLVIHAPKICPDILRTNDLVEFNEKGQFKILGRKDNTINTGGIKVQIEEVETSLRKEMKLPFLITSAPDPKFGEQIVLLVETEEAPSCSSQQIELIQSAISTLPPYWRPKKIVCVAHLPLTGTGKPDRATAKTLVNR